MLNDTVLLVVSVTVSLVGIGALAVLLATAELPLEDVTAVDAGREGESVRIHATVSRVSHGKNSSVTILTLNENVERTGVVFDVVNVTKGDEVDVIGTIQMYNDEPELVIRKIVVGGKP